ncbi:MAG: YHYH protein [Verrucomicrobiota bacterium]
MIRSCLLVIFFCLAAIHLAPAHGVEAGKPATDDEVLRAHILAEWEQARAASKRKPGEIKPLQVAALASTLNLAAAAVVQARNAPAQSRAFQAFPKLDIQWDKDFLFIGSNGLPDHGMMVGITAWQQQVPLPQAYVGSNAWRIPLHPVPAQEPALIKGRFLRGAIALAANGIPIFNPQNNRGEVSQEIGELDQWGGHCGRADDYHYHAAPLHLQTVVGKGMPIAYALDGYPIYGLTEPDGSLVGKLDVCHGHETAALGYHYHASTKYPYVMGGFHGEVTEAEGQVDPQPRASPVRPDTPPLRGAVITDFESTGANSYRLSYTVAGEKRSVSYTINTDGTYPFEYDNGKDGLVKEVYSARAGGRGQGGEPRQNRRKDERPPMRGESLPSREKRTQTSASPSRLGFVLTSSAVEDGGNLPPDFTGDGSGATLPLAWKGAPAGTTSYALIMDHEAPGNEMKGYWTMWDIPATVTSLPKNVQAVGKLGIGFRGNVGYEPPHSKGPGEKTYVLHVYALSAAPQIREPASQVNREVLLAALQDKILATADLRVVYSRQSDATESRAEDPPPPPPARGERPNRKGGK